MSANEALEALSATQAKELILQGHTGPLHFCGTLDLSGQPLQSLPEGLRGDVLDVSDTGLEHLPLGLQLGELRACNLPLTHLPALQVKYRLLLDGCTRLSALPSPLQVGVLSLQDCISLETLPEGLDVHFLNLNRCEALRGWPQEGRIAYGHLSLRDCLSLRELPKWLERVAQLDLAGCRGITQLPPLLHITGWLDLAGTGLSDLGGKHWPLRWRGVRIDERIAFEPHTITGQEVLAQPNAEVRRVMMERMGYERFLSEVEAEVLDQDQDAGGPRMLLRVPLEADEPFVALSVRCPSTGRQYVLRVPPHLKSAHAASAWLAGFDDPAQYQPVQEA